MSSFTWPRPPVVLGQRVFHWTAWHAELNEIVSTGGFCQLQFTEEESTKPFFIRTARVTSDFAKIGDVISIYGIGDQLTNPGFFTRAAHFNNRTGSWDLFEFFEQEYLHDRDVYASFGLPLKRKAVRHILETYYGAMSRVCLERCGFEEPEISEYVANNVVTLLKRYNLKSVPRW